MAVYSNLEIDFLLVMAKHRPFSIADIKRVFKRVRSFDVTLLILNSASENSLSLEDALKKAGF